MNIRAADVAEAYTAKVAQRQQAEDRDQADQKVRLNEAFAKEPYKRPPGPDSTTSVVA